MSSLPEKMVEIKCKIGATHFSPDFTIVVQFIGRYEWCYAVMNHRTTQF